MSEKICKNCKKHFSDSNPRVIYHSEACRHTATAKRNKRYRELPENIIKQHERYKKRYVRRIRKSRSYNTRTKESDRKLFDEFQNLSKGVYTRSEVQHMTVAKLIRACDEGLTIAV